MEKKRIDHSKIQICRWSMSDAIDLTIKFSLTEHGEESQSTLKMKPYWVWELFHKASGQ